MRVFVMRPVIWYDDLDSVNMTLTLGCGSLKNIVLLNFRTVTDRAFTFHMSLPCDTFH